MTDQPKEWRDEQGRKLTVDSGIDEGSFFTLFETGGAVVGLDEGWARFLLRVLPEALGIDPRCNVCGQTPTCGCIHDYDIQAATTGEGLTFDVELLKKRVELDAEIVSAAERYYDGGDIAELRDAVGAKRAALKGE